MPVGKVCVRQVVVATRETSALEAAKVMRQYDAGDSVVTDETDGRCLPVGIIADRNIVSEVLAPELDAPRLSAGDIMTSDLTIVMEKQEAETRR